MYSCVPVKIINDMNITPPSTPTKEPKKSSLSPTAKEFVPGHVNVDANGSPTSFVPSKITKGVKSVSFDPMVVVRDGPPTPPPSPLPTFGAIGIERKLHKQAAEETAKKAVELLAIRKYINCWQRAIPFEDQNDSVFVLPETPKKAFNSPCRRPFAITPPPRHHPVIEPVASKRASAVFIPQIKESIAVRKHRLNMERHAGTKFIY